MQDAINHATPFDTIALANGTYKNNAFHISTGNITIMAANPGGVFLNGTNDILISGNHVTFSGFQFTSGSTQDIVIRINGNHDFINQLNFNGYSAQKYINIQGQYDTVAYCNFEKKPNGAPQGDLIHIAPNDFGPNYATIRYCSFQNMKGKGGDNGNECIRIANGAQSTSKCRTVVEYCYFENTGDGDSEAISVKSCENVLRFNTFRNNQKAMMVFRNGNNNVAYGNFFINAGGIRIKDANNIYCYNNYFENSGQEGEMNTVTFSKVDEGHQQNINFIHNTFVDCYQILFSDQEKDNTWANNIFKQSSGAIFSGSNTGINWLGNIYKGSLGMRIRSGITKMDPMLKRNEEGYYSLTETSPAIQISDSTYPEILHIDHINDDYSIQYDISGRLRPTEKSEKAVGCSEYIAGPTSNHPLVLNEVGPPYLRKVK